MRKSAKVEPKKEDCCEDFKEILRQALDGCEEPLADWLTTAIVIKETEREVLGM